MRPPAGQGEMLLADKRPQLEDRPWLHKNLCLAESFIALIGFSSSRLFFLGV